MLINVMLIKKICFVFSICAKLIKFNSNRYHDTFWLEKENFHDF